ncbi:hypothetical protein, partial [Sphingomonas pruni]|uniref:hypothetical protein n=1 Tax=Sphingomonas pruni TaxID=40683 RepID=UPI001C3FA638
MSRNPPSKTAPDHPEKAAESLDDTVAPTDTGIVASSPDGSERLLNLADDHDGKSSSPLLAP